MTKKPCTLKMLSFPTNSELALKFSAWLTAICGGGTSQSQSQQTASRAMKFLKFCAEEDDDELSYTFIDFCLGAPKLITSFTELLKSEWSLGSSAQLSYLHAIGDLIDFRKANSTTPDILQHFAISEIYLTRGEKYLAKQKKLEWNRDLHLDSLIAVKSWATLEEMDQVIPFHLDRFKDVLEHNQ